MSTTQCALYPPHSGDLIIETSDGVLFGVHILLLRLSSSVMSDMLTVGSGSGDTDKVTITEDSTIFRALLSFIYPDKTPTLFTNLTSLIPVLDAAAKYDMKGVLQSLCLQLMKGTTGDTLIYEDPLWVYSKAKQFHLTDLERVAAQHTLAINLSEAQRRPEVTNAPASWMLELLTLRTEHIEWWKSRCQHLIPIANMNEQYETIRGYDVFYRQTPCQCRQMDSASTINPPLDAVMKIMERPCARSVREIDFNRILGCLRCGAAATAHYQKICLEYEKKFGKF